MAWLLTKVRVAVIIENSWVDALRRHAADERDVVNRVMIMGAADEIERLRALVTAWAVAHDRFYSQRVGGTYPRSALHDARNALREAVGQ